jgi:hypothetical protein
MTRRGGRPSLLSRGPAQLRSSAQALAALGLSPKQVPPPTFSLSKRAAASAVATVTAVGLGVVWTRGGHGEVTGRSWGGHGRGRLRHYRTSWRRVAAPSRGLESLLTHWRVEAWAPCGGAWCHVTAWRRRLESQLGGAASGAGDGAVVSHQTAIPSRAYRV